MNRREISHVAAIFAVALVARLLLFDVVGIWGDFGFYSFNSRLILEGQTPYIDFLGRSPLFIYSYAAVRATGVDVVTSLRTFIVAWWVVAAVPVYLIANHIRGHTSGLAALSIYLLSPFALTYGFWANTQSLAAALAIGGLYAVVRRDHPRSYLVLGIAVAAAFLSRRSVIVIGLATIVFVADEYRRSTLDHSGALSRLTAAAAGGGVTLAAGYLAVARGDLGTAWALFETHGVALVASVGRGGYPLLGVDAPPVVNEIGSGRVPILNDICQMCGAWTARTFAKTLLVTVPVAGIAFVYVRDMTDAYFSDGERLYMFGALGAVGLYAAAVAAWAGFPLRSVAVLALVLFAVGLYRGDAVGREILYSRGMRLLLVVLAAFAAGYLYRNRLLHTYYFMDFWPALSVVTGVAIVAAWHRVDVRGRQVVAVALVIAVVVSSAGAYPVTNIVLDDNDAGWFTTENIDDYSADIDGRTDAGDVVLVANPTYLTDSHARMVNDNARIHYLYATFSRYGDDGPAGPLYQDINAGLQDGEITHVIMTTLTLKMIRWDDTTTQHFEDNYCEVDTGGLYDRTNSTLYRYEPTACDERPDIDAVA